jgi:hypothetical protein
VELAVRVTRNADLLLSPGDLRAALTHQGVLLRDAIEGVPEEHLLRVDEDEWVPALVDEFKSCSSIRFTATQ